MAGDPNLIIEMVTVMGAATVGGYIASRCQQPVLLGYLLGGVVVGPSGLGLIALKGDIQVLAEIGVALLLFALGVEFSLKDLLRVKAIALGGGSLQILLTILLGGGLAYATGWVDSVPQAAFLGSVLALSSTAVVLKSLIERNQIKTPHGKIMLAMLIVQDLGLGVMLAVLPALAEDEAIGAAVAMAILKLLVFLGGAIAAGRWLIPALIRLIVRQANPELFLLAILVLCLGIALVTSALGLGIEMGAFVAGLMVSNVEYADHALDRVLPMRDVFATLFFASIGLLIDPGFLWENASVLLGLVAITLVGKALIVTAIVRAFGYSLKTALTVGTGINQIGEFSFVLAGVAQASGLFSERLYGLAVGTAAATLVLTPLSLRLTPHLIRWLERSPRFARWMQGQPSRLVGPEPQPDKPHIIVAGYGRVGQILVRLLDFQGHPLLVIDNDEAKLQILRERQIPYLFGDASSIHLLEKAQIHTAKALAITLPDPMATRLVLNRALSLAPDLDITVRAHDNRELDPLYQLGAKEVVQPEFEAGLEIGAHVLLTLGESALTVQQLVHRYRQGRYRDILPGRSQYWGVGGFEQILEGLNHRWYDLPGGHPLVAQSLATANIRRTTGVTIMAIARGKQMHRYPLGETVLEAGDRLLVVGDAIEQAAFAALLHQHPD